MTAHDASSAGPRWLNAPSRWAHTGQEVVMTSDPGTRFWRHTGSGEVQDSGHLLGWRVAGSFLAEVRVHAVPKIRQDLAGLMVRMDAERWMTCGLEFGAPRHHVSSVVTHGVSDWACAPLEHVPTTLALTVHRLGDALRVEYSADGAPKRLARVAFFPAELPVLVGPMTCSPGRTGFEARFSGFSVDPV